MSTPIGLPFGLPTSQNIPAEVNYTATATDALLFASTVTSNDASSMNATATDAAVATYTATAADIAAT